MKFPDFRRGEAKKVSHTQSVLANLFSQSRRQNMEIVIGKFLPNQSKVWNFYQTKIKT